MLLTASNALGIDTNTLVLTINAPPVITSGMAGSAYTNATISNTITASGTPTPVFTGSNLPAGLTLNSTNGVLSGTLSNTVSVGTNTFSVTASNSVGTVTADYNLVVLDQAAQSNIPVNVVINKYANTTTDRIELLVVGNGTAGSTVDMRGMIIKDTSSSMANDSGGKFEFSSTSPLWASVRAGTLIVLSSGTNSVEDTTSGGSDYTLAVNLGNTNDFTPRGGSFDIATTDMIILKAAGTGADGVAGGIHALGGGVAGTQYTTFTGKKIRATTTSGTDQGVYVNNANALLSDYYPATDGSGATGAVAVTSLAFGSFNTAGNDSFIKELRGLVDGSGIASIVNGLSGATYQGKNVFPKNQLGQTVEIVFTPTSSTLPIGQLEIEVPVAFGVPASGNVSVIGTGTENASTAVLGQVVTISNLNALSPNSLTIRIANLETPDTSLSNVNNGNYSFTIRSAGTTGSLAALGGSPSARVLIPVANLKAVDPTTKVPTLLGQTVAVEGVCLVGRLGSGSTSTVLQEGASGVQLYSATVVSGPQIRGNRYGAVGVVGQTNGVTQITLTATNQLLDLGAGTLPTPQVVTVTDLNTNGEEYENRLIRIEGLTYVSGTWGTAQSIIFQDSATNQVTIRIQSASTASVQPSGVVNITGIGGQFDTASPFDSGYQLQPRDLDDVPAPPTITSSSFTGTVGVTFSNRILFAGASNVSAVGSLPGGLVLDSSSGWVTGTPTVAAPSGTNVSVTASNAYGTTNRAILFTIAKGTSSITVSGATNFIYSASPQGPASTGTKTGSTNPATFSYVGTNGTSFGPLNSPPVNAGSYAATAAVTADDNYNGASSAPLGFLIVRATPDLAGVSATALSNNGALSNSVISGARFNGTNLPGTYAFSTPTNIPTTTASHAFTFMPDDTNNFTTASGMVSVVVSTDTNPPTVKLSGVNPIILPVGGTFADPGATAQDVVGSTTNSVAISSTNSNVDPALPGTYEVTYSANDGANTGSATRTVIVKAGIVALDSSANYGGGWSSGTNGGFGFGAWTISHNNDGAAQRYAGSFIGDPTSAEITGMGSQAFGLYANPNTNGPFVDASRSLSNALAIGQTLSFQWAINWDSGNGGNKGFNLLVGTNEIVNVNNAGTAAITLNGTDVGFGYGKAVMTWSFTRTSSNNILVTANDRDGLGSFSTNITVANAPSAGLDGLKFYASNMEPSDQRQAYFNNLVVETPDTNGPTLTLKAGVDSLTWFATNSPVTVSTNDVDVSDPSGIASLTVTPASVDTSTDGIATVTYMAVDGIGNSSSLSRVIVVGSAAPADHQVTTPATNLSPIGILTVRSRIAIPGATDGEGQAPNLGCWIGVGKVAGDPATWAAGDLVAWLPATYSGQLTGTDDEYTADVDLTALGLVSGNYYLVARWQIGTGPYFYSGGGGPWDASNNPSVDLTVTTGAPYDLWLGGAATNNRSIAEFAMGSPRPGTVPYQGTNPAVEMITNDISGTNYLRQNYWVRDQEVNVDGTIVVTPQVGSSLNGVYSNVVHNQNGRMGTVGPGVTVVIGGTSVSLQRRFVEVPMTGSESKKFLRIKIEKP